MKAIGARRRDIRRIYLRTALLLGALGALLGAALGIAARQRAREASSRRLFFGIDAGFGVVGRRSLVASLLVGLVGPPLAALPGDPARDAAAAARGAAGVRVGRRRPGPRSTRAAAARALPAAQRADRPARARPPQAAQPRDRDAGRRSRSRTLLALLSLGAGVAQDRPAAGSTTTTSTSGSRPWPASRSAREAAPPDRAPPPGVRDAQPWMQNNVRLDGRDAAGLGPAGASR